MTTLTLMPRERTLVLRLLKETDSPLAEDLREYMQDEVRRERREAARERKRKREWAHRELVGGLPRIVAGLFAEDHAEEFPGVAA